VGILKDLIIYTASAYEGPAGAFKQKLTVMRPAKAGMFSRKQPKS
jgi:hypothetical protein